jgi:hypothetical protein
LNYPLLFTGFYSIKNNKRKAMNYPASAPLNYRGRLTESKPRTPTIMLDGGARPWRVTRDPSQIFLNGVFRVSDMLAGGFDPDTIFTNTKTGEQRIVDADGIARKIRIEKGRKHRKQVVFVKPVKPVTGGSGGIHAIL